MKSKGKNQPALCRVAILIVTVAVLSLATAQGNVTDPDRARDGSVLGGLAPSPHVPGAFLIDEDFADITSLPGAGWILANNSSPLGSTDWFQGNDTVFPAHMGASTAYIGANFNNTSGGTGVISNWLVSPELDLSIVDELHIWTRTATGSAFPDRAEIRLCSAGPGACDPNGLAATDIGNFTTLLAEINPSLAVGGYPEVWTEFAFSGLQQAATGRIAFRYYVTDAGPSGINSNYIGVDTWQVAEVSGWSENFDSYATGMQLHGVGGWKGWDNNPAVGALTSSTRALSPPNSVDILGPSDLVHEYTGFTSGTWTYTAYQYIPAGFAGQSFFILLNTYADGGPYNWSTQVQFDASGMVVDTGVSGATLPLLLDQWVEIRVVIDLTGDTQSFYYGGQLLYTGTWTGHVSGGGTANIGAVSLFANNASSVFYDNMSLSLSSDIFADDFESGDTSAWSQVVP